MIREYVAIAIVSVIVPMNFARVIRVGIWICWIRAFM